MFTILIDPKKLIDLSWMHHEVEEIVKYCKASPPVEQGKPVLVAGDPERLNKSERKDSGIPLDDETWKQLLIAGESLGMSKQEMHVINS